MRLIGPAGMRAGWNSASQCARGGGEDRLDARDDLPAAGAALGVRAEARLRGGLRLADRLPEPRPQVVVAEPERDRQVGGLERLIDRDDAVGAAAAGRHLARAEIRHDAAGQEAGHRIDQRDVDHPAPPGGLAGEQRRQRRQRRVLAGQHVGGRGADLLRLAALRPGDVHHAGIALGDEVVAGPVGTLAGQAEAGDRGVDEVGLDRPEAVGIEPELAGHPRRLVEQHRVAAAHEVVQHRRPSGPE